MSEVLDLQSNVFSGDGSSYVLSSASSTSSSASENSSEKGSGRFREPLSYTTASLGHPPKWPIECQVIPEKIRHISAMPSKFEPFYSPSKTEPEPRPVGSELGTIIFNYSPKLSVDYFCRSCVGGAEELQSFESDVNTLKFESRFESGNLQKAIKVTNVYYELYLREDLYTEKNSNWYYFRVQNTKENIIYRFSIVNFNKPDSLYRYGLKPLMYSEKEAQLNRIGWIRSGHNISYYKNDLISDDTTYTLTFNIKFKHNNDTIYFAQCYPYTYTMLQNYLTDIETDRFKSQLCQQRLLCKTLAGNNVYILTITSPNNYLEENMKKPVVCISSRVHPGETQSSYMMKGIIDFLTSDSSHAKELRDRFIFKLIPMLNPDGVIVGNSRCCLLGQDLNRQYRTVLREAFPQIYQIKVMLRRYVEENSVYLYCDIHGHSRKNNVFIYGCENRRVPEKRLIEQVFPLMMHKNAADKFSFQNCKFKIHRSKEGTGRVFVWTLGIVNSYTLEISLAGSTLNSRQYTHFNTADYEGMGRHFCETLLDYSDNSPQKEKIKEKILQKLLESGSSAEEPVNVPISDYSSLSHSDTDESENEIEDIEKDPSSHSNNNNNNNNNKHSSSSNSASGNKKVSIKRQCSIRHSSSSKGKLRPSNTNTNSSHNKQSPGNQISKSSIEISNAKNDSVRNERKSNNKEANANVNELPQIILTKENNNTEFFEEEGPQLQKKIRRNRKIDFPLRNEQSQREVLNSLNLSPPKYTSLLFDDPFNPPELAGNATRSKSRERIPGQKDESFSHSEDECDDDDRVIKSKKFLKESVNEMFTDFSLLHLENEKSDPETTGAALMSNMSMSKVNIKEDTLKITNKSDNQDLSNQKPKKPMKLIICQDSLGYHKSERRKSSIPGAAFIKPRRMERRSSVGVPSSTSSYSYKLSSSASVTALSSSLSSNTNNYLRIHTNNRERERKPYINYGFETNPPSSNYHNFNRSKSTHRRVSWNGNGSSASLSSSHQFGLISSVTNNKIDSSSSILDPSSLIFSSNSANNQSFLNTPGQSQSKKKALRKAKSIPGENSKNKINNSTAAAVATISDQKEYQSSSDAVNTASSSSNLGGLKKMKKIKRSKVKK